MGNWKSVLLGNYRTCFKIRGLGYLSSRPHSISDLEVLPGGFPSSNHHMRRNLWWLEKLLRQLVFSWHLEAERSVHWDMLYAEGMEAGSNRVDCREALLLVKNQIIGFVTPNP